MNKAKGGKGTANEREQKAAFDDLLLSLDFEMVCRPSRIRNSPPLQKAAAPKAAVTTNSQVQSGS